MKHASADGGAMQQVGGWAEASGPVFRARRACVRASSFEAGIGIWLTLRGTGTSRRIDDRTAGQRRLRHASASALAVIAVIGFAACQDVSVDASTQTASAAPTQTKPEEACRVAAFASGVVASSNIPGNVAVDLGPFATVDEALAAGKGVDWRNDTRRAAAITLAYAATEIRDHLASIGIAVTINGSSGSAARSSIALVIDETLQLAADPQVDATEGFQILPAQNLLCIKAPGRVGALYGAYRLLEEIGFAWHDPYETLRPVGVSSTTTMSFRSIAEVPRIGLRGFWTVGTTPARFQRWMARNRLNIVGAGDASLGQMLGIREWGGGHYLIQEEFSRPGLFEQHPTWFGERGGVRRPIPPEGFFVNPSFASEAAADYFASRLVDRLESRDLKNVDVLNLWPADNRSDAVFDQSAAARALGNEVDQLLFFYANVQDNLQKARQSGRLSRPVRLAGISYYATWKAPTNAAVVARLENSDYLHVFYTNTRSFSAPFGGGGDESNRRLGKQIAAWQSAARLNYGIVEYYNYSVYGAVVPAGADDSSLSFEALTRGNGALFAYMHPLNRNPGPLRLANTVLAKLMWRVASGPSQDEAAAARAARVRDAYFKARYGTAAADWADVWANMTRSVSNAKELFGEDGLTWSLFQNFIWSEPWYSPAEVASIIPMFRNGGQQTIPARWSGNEGYPATFLGLDASIAMQAAAQQQWEMVLAQSATLDPAIRARMAADVEWFAVTRSRYRLMAATCDYFLMRGTPGESAARDRMLAEITLLESTTVLKDTISPMNQRLFLRWHRLLAGAPIPDGADY